MIQTTFRKLHDAGACKERYRFLAKALGGIKAYGRDTPITLLQILNINGLDDALWALRACDDAEKFSRLLACDYAEHVLHLFEAQCPGDDRPHKTIEVARRYARGEAMEEALAAARAAAWDAAGAAAWDAARPAAWYAWAACAAAWDAARPAAWYAWAAAWAAAGDAACAAAGDAAWAAAWDAGAACAAAGDAARPAAWYACAAAWDAERTWQEARLRELLERGRRWSVGAYENLLWGLLVVE